jgi:hypothetical protein
MKAFWLISIGLLSGSLTAQTHLPLLETLRQLALEQHPEWAESELDSAYAIWMQWTIVGAPREAGGLSFLPPQEQFRIEIYQSQFGWPRDSTEWRAIPLTSEQREALQALYHGARYHSIARTRGPIDPLVNLGWSCSGCQSSSLERGIRAGLTSSAASATAQPWSSPTWSLRSPSDYPVRFWAGPRSVAFGLRPSLLPRGIQATTNRSRSSTTSARPSPNGAQSSETGFHGIGALRPVLRNVFRRVDQFVLGWDTSKTVFGDASIRFNHFGIKAGVSARGWAELSGTWYGPGGLLVMVQREWAPGGLRPGAGATPWRPLRGNRATAAMPLWAGRLSIQQTSTGPSATWVDRSRSVLWYPGQLGIGFREDLNPLNTSSPVNLRSHLYLGRAQGASVQLRCPSGPFTTEIGLAGITLSPSQPNVLELLLDGNLNTDRIKNPYPTTSSPSQTTADVLPRATGPMTLWRPGWTAETALTYTKNFTRMSARIRRSPSGWSGSIRAQLPLN